MGQTTIHQIEAQIDHTREQLGTNLHELSRRVESATDWQEYYRSRPFVFLGAAAVGGALAAVAINLRNSRPSSSSSNWSESARSAYSSNGGSDTPSRQVSEFWRNMQAAVVGLAAARLREYIETLLPGFSDHYQRVERHAADGYTGRNAPMDLSQR
jgi:hypothetical protein